MWTRRRVHASPAISTTRTEVVSAAVSPQFIEEDPSLFNHAYASLRVPTQASTSAPTTGPPSVEEWMPVRDSDFEHEDYEPPDVASFPSRPLPNPPIPTSFDVALKKPRRRRRTAAELAALEAATPPLAPGTVPSADETRFDWRQQSLSATPRAKGRHWFPDAWRSRVPPPMTKVSEVQPLWAEIRRYAEHFVPLLQAEQEEAERQFAVRLREWPNEQLQREGYMFAEMSASTAWQPKFKVEGTVISFYSTGRAATRPLPPHQFEPGQTVILSRTDPLTDAVPDPKGPEDTPLRGNVLSHGRGHVRVIFPHAPQDIGEGKWRIDIGCSDLAFKKQTEALTRLHLDPVAQDMSEFADKPVKLVPKSMEDEVLAAADAARQKTPEQRILFGTALRDLLLRRFQADYTPKLDIEDSVAATTHNMAPCDMEAGLSPTPHDADSPRGILTQNKLIDSWTRRYRTPAGVAPLVVEGDPEISLNDSQTRAIAMMLSERLSLVQGPPGTGKTRVIVEAIKLLKRHWQVPHPILVCAHTNVAVDNVLASLREHGLKVVRFGTASRVPESLQDVTFEALLEKHPLWGYLDKLRREREDIQSEIANGGMSQQAAEGKQKQSTALSRRIFMMRRRIQFEVLADADVVCTTCLSATSRWLDAVDFPFVFLDEASMATEPLSLVPLTKGSAQVAIIGDHKQLPPVIVSEAAQAGGLATSLFERLIHEHHIPSIMLDTQYRMHPSISAFSAGAFYDGALRDGTRLSDGCVRPGLEPPATAFLLPNERGETMNMTFLNHDFPESPQNRSIANHHEAGRICDIVADLLHNNPTLRGSDIGVIAPYAAQIRTVSEYLTADAARGAAFQAWLGSERAAEVADIEVKTVDGFEGREKDVILFSTTRCNPAGYIGFLADWRRLNVGLTRAKRGLIILGSAATLSSARIGDHHADSLPRDGVKVWRQFIKYLKEGGMVMDDPA
ncbi:hypothetical protein CspeluHIS016_0102010 [Cutaneotrichosporon spelunceum]|uniref:P-loop containing nucleoside triphosphate hydrolase protein n=1 Tax=Cutaneotrichosporon spelunceum TaxID=1672016 RepID=A0AAD3Y7G2_9TREE|nr:hypothetical protein CspeluHIS016_0102010 [Cutaneotrichosporon spelunceum]